MACPAHGEAPRQAVRSGVASSAKVIAAAAIIMISVLGSFILNGDPTIKQFGVGLSVAVLLASAIEGEPGPPTPEPAPGRTAAQPLPGTAPWPEPSSPAHEPTAPADGNARGGHVPDDHRERRSGR